MPELTDDDRFYPNGIPASQFIEMCRDSKIRRKLRGDTLRVAIVANDGSTEELCGEVLISNTTKIAGGGISIFDGTHSRLIYNKKYDTFPYKILGVERVKETSSEDNWE